MTRNNLKRISFIVLTLCLALGLMVVGALAVDSGKTSYTAEAVCAFRAIGARDPDPKTRNPDHMAKLFVNPAFYNSFPGLGLDYKDAKVAMDQMNHGVFYYVNARTLHMDAKLTQALKAGFQQVVIMGAGFDSRAYRFHEAYPKVRFFEIDLPATSAVKQERVQKILGQKPDWVTFVPIDFNAQTLDEVLGEAGFEQNQKTFYVWEGVTYFISQAGVEGTLAFISEKSAPGSRIVFDYMLADVVQGYDYSAYGARRVVYHVASRGEPYVFGIAPDQSEAYVNQQGLALLSDLGPEDLTRKYLMKSDGSPIGKISGFLRIAHAEVPPAAQQQVLKRKAEKQGASAVAPDKSSEPVHQVAVSSDVQKFLDGFSNSLLKKDYVALRDSFSPAYQFNGRGRDAAVAYLKRGLDRRPIQEHGIILTKFKQNGGKAEIDGFISRKGFRTPLMIRDIVKEADGRWRWYGNQQ